MELQDYALTPRSQIARRLLPYCYICVLTHLHACLLVLLLEPVDLLGISGMFCLFESEAASASDAVTPVSMGQGFSSSIQLQLRN
jgi:hypothetical protein